MEMMDIPAAIGWLNDSAELDAPRGGRFIHAIAFRRFVFCNMGISEAVVE